VTTALILRWLAGHWRQIAGAAVIGLIVIGASSFYSSWKMRGVKVDRLQIELDSSQLARASERQVCAELAAILREQQAAIALWQTKHDQLNARHKEAMSRAVSRVVVLREDAATSSERAVSAIRRAEGCEAKVTALAAAVKEWRP